MSQDTSMGAIRPKNTQTVQHTDGTTDTITWVREATCIKRLRRALAKKNHTLLITREGTPARRELGMYAVLDADGDVLQRNANLSDLARFLGVLAANEGIEEPIHKGWLFYVARQTRVVVNGTAANYAQPVTRKYRTESAALKAAEHIADRDNLLICSFDASAREAP